MYELKPISERVARVRERYRTTKPAICIARYRIITEFYMANPQLTGILKRAKCFYEICREIPVRIEDDDVIVGNQGATFRSAALYPENSVDWLKREVGSGFIRTRDLDPYDLDEDDAKYIMDTVDFWMKECMSAKIDAYIPEAYLPMGHNGVTLFSPAGNCPTPVGHFCTNYNKAIRKGFAAIKAEADEKTAELEKNGIFGTSVDQYNFYRAISIVCDGMMLLTKRYAALAEKMAAAETEPNRKAELESMADSLNVIMEKPCRTFQDAVMCLQMYQTCLCLDANLHGISMGRVDQYLGDFYEADLAAGRITPERAQELIDLFYLKLAEMNKPWSYEATHSNPGYTCGMLITMGGVKADGTDASNPVTYMMLQASGRLSLHNPPQALRVHKGTPESLWEAAIATTRLCGGVPTFESDDAIIPALMARGLSLESARNYCLIGCVEPGGCGDEWPACGGTGAESYWNMENAFMIAINNGRYPCPTPDGKLEHIQVGPETGYLYEMKSFEEVKRAVEIQFEHFIRWHQNNVNIFEYVAREVLPLPVVSATMDGCMEKGADVMYGGAKYNSTGLSGVGLGNITDSLAVIKQAVFDEKICTAQELYSAIMNNWKGYEDLQQTVKHSVKHYGNADADTDANAKWVAETFAKYVTAGSGPRGNHFSAGLYPVTINIMFGSITAATPDGRNQGEPLADGISPVQQMDKKGPTSVINSVTCFEHNKFANGTLLNMKFHPTALANPGGVEKLEALMKTYFASGGMEMQLNIVSSETLRDAQKHPEKYQNLVVRVAGFSSYFVELHPESQNDLISRTELTF